jgi:hypothetical protein
VEKLPVYSVIGDFTLTDHNGKRFEPHSLRGKAVLKADLGNFDIHALDWRAQRPTSTRW